MHLVHVELYADVYNDIHAVKIHPQVLRLAEGPDEYIRTGLSNRLDPHVDFAEELAGTDHMIGGLVSICLDGR